MNRLLVVVAVAVSLSGFVFGRDEELDPSPWVVDKTDDTKGASNRALFTGVNFAVSHNIHHNLKEYRVFYGDILGMETVMKYEGETDLFYREVTDGKKVIKAVYNGRKGIVDCDMEKDRTEVDTLIAQFLSIDQDVITVLRQERDPIDVISLIGDDDLLRGNATWQLLETSMTDIPEPYATLADIEYLQRECIQFHHNTKHYLKDNHIDMDAIEELAMEFDEQQDLQSLQQQYAEKHGRRSKRVRRSVEEADNRVRRSLLIPDTKWCGAGADSEEFADVGQSRASDRCCREHDHCPYFVEGFSSNYNMFNYYFHTVSHCMCDENFRTCLRSANTGKSVMIGNIFFNILNMKCFEFETDDVCVERSWWGRCTRTEPQTVAKIRGSLDWP